MSKTQVFLSSTCFDLRALREHLREKVRSLGHDLLASEYASFPVSPDLTTVENCKKAVRDNADLLILVVGGRRGSVDPASTRSVVNAEYREARAKGIDCFVFVERQVWDLLPIYEKNPVADFSPVVDHHDVFKFVAELKSESRWIFTFANTDEILTTIGSQLSVYLKSLITRSRAGHLMVPREFSSSSRAVTSLLQDRPPFWEYLLTCELLEQGFADAAHRMSELEQGFVYRTSESLSELEVMDRVSTFFHDLLKAVTPFDAMLRAIPPSWGPPGVSGDPVAINTACRRVTSLVDALVEWETRVRFVKVPEIFQPLIEALYGSTREVIAKLQGIPVEIRKGVELAKTSPGRHEINIHLALKAPENVKKFEAELAKLRRHLGLS